VKAGHLQLGGEQPLGGNSTQAVHNLGPVLLF
jgi:hypothetical protein